jgi:hypothetical protein
MACHGPDGTFIELDADGNELWRYVSPVDFDGPMTQGEPADGNLVFRCTFIPPDHPGLQGHDLTPGAPIELQPNMDPCIALSTIAIEAPEAFALFPVPANGMVMLPLANGMNTVSVVDAQGCVVMNRGIEGAETPTGLDISALTNGNYGVLVQQGERRWTGRLVVIH